MINSNRFTWICIFAILFIHAAALDEECNDQTRCPAVPGTDCRNGRCRCNTPFYQVCNSTCDVVRYVASEGSRCVAPENCIENADCVNEKCQCRNGFSAKNGACFRNLYTACTTNKECWSEYCFLTICQCPPGSEPTDNVTTCRQKLVDVYDNWDEANRANAFCQSKASCFDTAAECFNDTTHPQSKFCKCPTGYRIDSSSNRRRCEAIKSPYLSPIETDVVDYGTCGTCDDENAVCINVVNKQTCWCQAGYTKNGNKCQSLSKSAFVFPNGYDAANRDFKAGCSPNSDGTSELKGGICVCARGYKFDTNSRSCQRIELQDYKPFLEYGLCTQINSKDQADSENGLCLEPLKCEARTDKYVCSCGIDRFLDIDNASQCVYYIGKGAGQTDRKCPSNTKNNPSGNCECEDGYKSVNDDRQCELVLSDRIQTDGPCPLSGSNLTVCNNFGVKAVLCDTGECRCAGNDSFPNEDQTGCVAPVEQTLDSKNKEKCPKNSFFQTDRCKCNAGYRRSSNSRQCDRLSPTLMDYQGSPTSTNVLNNTDCEALFNITTEAYNSSHCQCRSNAFLKDDRTGCWYKLNVTLAKDANSTLCPPESSFRGGEICVCNLGYVINGMKCVPATEQVYLDTETNKPNITGLNTIICSLLFGPGSLKSSLGGYCTCLANTFRSANAQRCLFYLNVTSKEDKGMACPANANISALAGGNTRCVCDPNYYPSEDQTSCERANITLVGTEDRNNNEICNVFTDSDCTAKFGAEAFCKDDKCYCNRKTSIATSNKDKCESLTRLVFPAEHDLYQHVCDEDKDCGGKSNVVCSYSDIYPNYKVCQCKPGSFLNPDTFVCEFQCNGCDTSGNFECYGDTCRCKSGYYDQGGKCVEYPKLQLFERCNASIGQSNNADQMLQCDANCLRAFCTPGYRTENDQCVRYQLRYDRCIQNPGICGRIDTDAVCSREVNQCLCKGFFYPDGNKCARSVSYVCTDDDQCGAGECKAGRCACRENQRIEETLDIDNRNIQYCVKKNGIDRLRISWLLISLVSLIGTRLF